MTNKIILITVLSVTPIFTFGASFDCSNVSAHVEKMICENAELSKSDDELDELYKKAKKLYPKDNDLVESQNAWIAERNECDEVNCLEFVYSSRKTDIESKISWNIERQAEEDAEVKDIANSSTQKTKVTKPQKVASKEIKHNVSPDKEPKSKTSSDSNADIKNTPAEVEKGSGIIQNIITLFVFFASISIAISFFGFAKRCPSCKKWFSDKKVGRKLVGSRQEFRTVTRQDHHKDQNGNIIKTVERQEQVQVNVSEYNIFHECGKCGHKWHTSSTVES